MKRRILSVVVLMVMFANMVVSAENSRAEIQEDEANLAASVISKLEIMDYSQNNENDIISRIDFAIYLSRLFRVNEYNKSTYSYYTDIPDDHYALTSVNFITEAGGFDGYGESTFKPDEPVKPAEAAKVILNMLGYRTYASLTGGYPSAYLKIAKDTELLKGFSDCSDITRKEMMVLLLRAGFVDKVTIVGSNDKDIKFKTEEGKDVFADYWDIHDNYGVVTGSGAITLDDGITNKDGTMLLNGVSYEDGGIDTEPYLGRYVRAVTMETDTADTLLGIIKYDKYNDEVTVDAADIDRYENNALYYTEGDSEKERKFSVDKAATVIYNGAVSMQSLEAIYRIKKGNISLIDVNRDSRADTVIVNSYKSAVVGYVDSNTETIFNKADGTAAAELKTYENSVIRLANGTRGSLSDIKKDNVVTIKENAGKYIEISISEETVSGALVMMFESDGRQCLQIDETDYKIDEDFINNNEWFRNGTFVGEIGKIYTFYLDKFGEIVYVGGVQAGTLKLGYLIKLVYDEAEEAAMIKLLTTDGSVQMYDFADRVKVDGETKKTALEVVRAVELGDGEVIQYKLNSEEEVTYIDTEFKGEKETSASIHRKADKGTYRANEENGSLGGLIYPASSVIQFIVPEENKSSAPDRDFSVKTGYWYAQDTNKKAAAYVTDSEHVTCDALVIYEGANDLPNFNTTLLFVINDISRTLNEDDEPVYRVEGYSRGAKKTYTFAADVMSRFQNLANNEAITLDDLEPGDAIRPAVNSKNQIYAMQLMVDYSDGLDTMPKWGPANGYYVEGMVDITARFYCRKMQNGVAELTFDKSPDAPVKTVSKLTGKPITVVDTSKKKDMVRVGTIDDVLEYDVIGNAVKPMFCFMWNYSARDIIIYK